jgi:prepilin-type N-terminal cleavage/methylation domain-containing protein
MSRHEEEGFSLVEVLVAIFLFSVLSVGFYQVMFSAVRGSSDTADIAEVAEEARLGFNRMIRDTREATDLISATDTSYRIWTDFDRDGLVDQADFEYMQYSYDSATRRLTLTALTAPAAGNPNLITGSETAIAGTSAETLSGHIRLVGTRPVFSYVSNFLQYDTSPANGEVSSTELDTASGLGNNNGVIDGLELDYVSDVNYAFEVSVGGDARTFYGQAQIRNRRYSNL